MSESGNEPQPHRSRLRRVGGLTLFPLALPFILLIDDPLRTSRVYDNIYRMLRDFFRAFVH